MIVPPTTVRRAGAKDAAELVRLRHAMFRAVAGAGAGSRPGEADDTSWYEAAHAALHDQMGRGVLAAFVVDDPLSTPPGGAPGGASDGASDGPGGPRLVASALVALHERLPGPGFPRGTGGSMSSVYVEEGHRRRGLARAVVSAGLEWLEARGAEVVDLHASPQAAGLYRSLGFAEPPSLSLRRLRDST